MIRLKIVSLKALLIIEQESVFLMQSDTLLEWCHQNQCETIGMNGLLQ